MAQQVTADAFLTTIFKTWYTDKRFPNLLFRNSPVLKKIQKNRIGGRNYGVSVLYGWGGNCSGDYVVAVAAAANSSRNAEFLVTPGNVFDVFNVTQKEILAAQDKKGAYVKSIINKMFAATEGLRKTLAACLYGYGYGDIGTLPALVAIGAATTTFNWDTIVKISVGTQFMVVNGAFPWSAYYDATIRTIATIDGQTVTWTGGVVGAVAWAAGSFIELAGGRDATPLPSMPSGLAAWIPSLANRAGANWATYIGTAFYGVTRSVSTNALAGWFYQRAGGEAYVDALTQGIKLCRRGGGVPDMICVNDEDYQTIVYECNAQTQFMQQVNTGGAKNSTNEVVRGISKMGFAFSTNWLKIVYDDPYCPRGTAYVLDSEVIEFAALSNVDTVIEDSIPENEPGSQSVEQAKEPDTTFKLIIDDYLSVTANSTSVEGPAAQVSLAIYGNLVVHEPAHCAVVVF